MTLDNKITLKEYLLFFLATLICLVTMYGIINQFEISSEINGNNIKNVNYGISYALEIIINNTRNFIQYIFFFPISPLLVLYELFIIAFQICLSINNLGEFETFYLLYKHGVLELPNMCLYMFLSLKCCILFFRNFRIKNVFNFIVQNRKIYIFSYALLVISGVIEGVVR